MYMINVNIYTFVVRFPKMVVPANHPNIDHFVLTTFCKLGDPSCFETSIHTPYAPCMLYVPSFGFF